MRRTQLDAGRWKGRVSLHHIRFAFDLHIRGNSNVETCVLLCIGDSTQDSLALYTGAASSATDETPPRKPVHQAIQIRHRCP